MCVQIEALKQMSRAELISWFQAHRGAKSRKLSVHVSRPTVHVHVRGFIYLNDLFTKVVGFGTEENDEDGGKNPEDDSCSTYGEVSKLTFLPPSAKMAATVAIMDISAFTQGLPLFPYHKILE